MQRVAGVDPLHGQDRLPLPQVALTEVGRTAALHLRQVTAEHVRDELASGEVGHLAGVHVLPVPQDRHPVTQLPELVQPVGDEDQADPLVTQGARDLEQGGDLGRLQRGGGLVHDHHAAVDRHRAGQSDHLLGAQAEPAQLSPDIQVDPEATDQLGGGPVHRPRVDQTQAGARLAAEEDVARH